ncbi:golgin subfamily A member 6-like protein 22 [Apis florea]|uniref:golgin subfamily A member 6-like protein 22 n=1 Tax=Apis florea TaxID=7463 RepID=UPI0012FF37D4|nr:golgin subfamily A member 6-like protein 22 [Apis florea]
MKFASSIEEKELSPEEAELIQKIKSKINVVRSMERLYAVPSEQLRVWLVWLSKVGDMADEWHKWLRSHIDFVLRLSIELRAAEEILRLEEPRTEETDPKKEEMKVETEIETKEIETDTKEDTKEETKEETKEDAKEETKEETKEDEKMEEKNTNNQGTRIIQTTKKMMNARELFVPLILETWMGDFVADDVTEEEEEITPGEEIEEEERQKEEEKVENGEEVTKTEEEKVEEEEEEKPIIKEWPVGIPWEHLGIEEEKEKPFDKRLPIPKNEAEMKDFLRKFTHEATIHRSSFKHWKDTADQAVKEIGNRLVIATFLVQGKDEKGEIKKPPVKKIFSPKPKKAKSTPRKDKKRKVASPARKTNREPEKTTQESQLEMSPSKRELEIRKMLDIDANDFVKDCARGAEPLPYFFYLKMEPDIDIAMEHDDEEIILADTERENINGDFQRLYFNLSDKPCKGGKPWML